MQSTQLPIKQLALGFCIALSGALIAKWIGTPIPWLLGSLIPTVIVRVNGGKVRAHHFFRKMGQWWIGIALGLYFSPTTVSILTSLTLPIFLSCLYAILAGLAGSWIIYKLSHTDYKTAFFASTIGGASEMVVLAEKNNANRQLTASAHSLRILIVTISLPMAYQFLNVQGHEADFQLTSTFSLEGLLLLLFLTGIVGLIFDRCKIPNAFVIGSVLVTGILTSQDIHLSNLPPYLQGLGQVFIGWTLGSNYYPGFFKQAPRFLLTICLTVVVYIVSAVGMAFIIAYYTDLNFPTTILGLSPGGIAEMAITAKALHLGAPIVTSFQVSRLIFVLLLAEPVFRLVSALQQKWSFK